MGISKIIAAVGVLVTSAVPCVCQNLVIEKFGNWVISRPAASIGFPITNLPTYPTTKSSQIPRQAPSQSSSPPSQKADSLQHAESLLEKQQYAEAANELQSVIKTQANNPQVWFDLGFAQSRLDRASEAAAAYKKAVELSPKWFEANLNLGLALAKSGNSADAATALRAATQLKPANGVGRSVSVAWFSLAQVLEQSAPQEALTAYKKAVELNPGNSDAVLDAGKLMEAAGDTAGAEKNYLQAVQMGNKEAMQPLIRLYLRQKRLPEAETRLREYQAKNSTPEVAVLLSHVLKEEGKLPEAIAILQPAASSNSTSAEMTRELASLYLENKQYADAAPLLQKLVAAFPNDAQLHWNLGSALLHQLKYPEAEAELLQALKLNPGLDDAYWELAYAAQQNKHYELAIRALDMRAKHLPETAATYWIRAVSYDGLHALKPAAENYKLFLETDGGKSPDDEFKARHRLKAIQH
jgi:tetratricopeptide (TPR) repeat protein